MTTIIHPTSNLKKIEEEGTFTLSRGKGVYVYDENGKEYIEGLSGLWCASLGYGNEELAETAAEQLRTFSFGHMFGGNSHQPGIQLSEKLAEMVPVDNARIFFGNSGSDANDTHIKILRYYYNTIGKPEKRKIISRERAYHGVTIGAASLTGMPPMHTHFDLPINALGIFHTDCPDYYRNGLPSESEEEFATRLADNLEKLIQKEGPDTVAAFIAEPVMGAGGVVVPPDTYFQKIQAVLKKYDVLFIDDEVICGFGRTGNPFGADTFGIKPQMMTLAKALSSAYLPISAAVLSGFMYEAMIEPSAKVGIFGHGYTYSGHPVSAAVALKVLEIYERDKVFDHAAMVGDYMQKKLCDFENHPLVGEVRGIGLVAAVELVADKKTKEAFKGGKVGAFCSQRCRENGLIIRPLTNTMAFCPPLIITESQVDETISRFAKSLDETLDFVTRENLMTA